MDLMTIDNPQLKALIGVLFRQYKLLFRYRQQVQHLQSKYEGGDSQTKSLDPLEVEFRSVEKEADQIDMSELISWFDNKAKAEPKKTAVEVKKEVNGDVKSGPAKVDSDKTVLQKQVPSQVASVGRQRIVDKFEDKRVKREKQDLDESTSTRTLRSRQCKAVSQTPAKPVITTPTVKTVATVKTPTTVATPASSTNKSRYKKRYKTNSSGEYLGLDRPTRIRGINKWLCDQPGCSYKARDRRLLENHLAEHGLVEPVECDKCNKTYKSQTRLYFHQMVYHAKHNYRCDYPGCKKKFGIPSSLKAHQMSHIDVRPFKCTIGGCGRRFKWNYILQRHQRVYHPNNRHNSMVNGQFRCAVVGCGKQYKIKWLLLRHQQTHASRQKVHQKIRQKIHQKIRQKNKPKSRLQTNVRIQRLEEEVKKNKFVCTVPGCGSRMLTKKKLLLHEAEFHAGQELVACKYPGCTKKYTLYGNMMVHFKGKHQKQVQRRSTCPWLGCGKVFKSKDLLDQHYKTHTGIVPVACRQSGCGETFLNESVMMRHFRMVHLREAH